MANIACKKGFFVQVEIKKNCYKNLLRKVLCTKDWAAPDKMTIPLNKLPNIPQDFIRKTLEFTIYSWYLGPQTGFSSSVARSSLIPKALFKMQYKLNYVHSSINLAQYYLQIMNMYATCSQVQICRCTISTYVRVYAEISS